MSDGDRDGANSGDAPLRDGINRLGWALARLLPQRGNLLFSPLGVGAALAALLPGARGETANELGRLLGLAEGEPGDVGQAVRALRDALRRAAAGEASAGPGPERSLRLRLATALFVDDAYRLRAEYTELLADAFEAAVSAVSFAVPARAAERINGWVEEATEGRISGLVTAGDVAPPTRLVLANAVYFLGAWKWPFEPERTAPAPFHLGDAERAVVDVPTMWVEESFRYWRGERVEAAFLDYFGGASMTVLLPDPGAEAEVAEWLSAGMLAVVDADARRCPLEVGLPSFEFGSSLRLGGPLRAAGLRTVFDPGRADFSGISPERGPLTVSEALHDAWIRVDEEGTEAAAATAFTVLGLSEPSPLQRFVVDRPFWFVIRERRSGLVLFVGRVTDPRG